MLTNDYTPAVGDVIKHPEWDSDMQCKVKYVGEKFLIGEAWGPDGQGGEWRDEVSFSVARAWLKVS